MYFPNGVSPWRTSRVELKVDSVTKQQAPKRVRLALFVGDTVSVSGQNASLASAQLRPQGLPTFHRMDVRFAGPRITRKTTWTDTRLFVVLEVGCLGLMGSEVAWPCTSPALCGEAAPGEQSVQSRLG